MHMPIYWRSFFNNIIPVTTYVYEMSLEKFGGPHPGVPAVYGQEAHVTNNFVIVPPPLGLRFPTPVYPLLRACSEPANVRPYLFWVVT